MNGNVISCAGTGQDGAYTINPLSYTDNGDGTVTDNNTGLMWQKEGDGSIYNWYQASGTYDASYNPTSQDACGSLDLGSYPDWRLPTKKELMSIVNYAIPYPGPTIEPVFSNTISYYWASTTLADNPSYAWIVNFLEGSVYNTNINDIDNAYFYVRCVRGGQYPVQSFVNNEDGTVTDNNTGLMWQQAEPDYMTWEQALNYCEGLNLANETDWRLPNIKEFESLTDDTRYDPAMDTNFFPNASSSFYWSSTTVAFYPNNSWVVACSDGSIDGHQRKDVTHFYVRCVRTIQYGNLEISPPSHDFVYVNVGTSSSPQNFTISNTGTADLHISNITLSDSTNYSLNVNGGSSPCDSMAPTITSDSSCTITVTFSPTSVGTKNANLILNSDDPYTPTINVQLTGVGVVLPMTLLAPNSNEIIPSGSIYTIQWTAPQKAVKFDLFYSVNNGTAWNPTASNIADSSYNWQVSAPSNNKKRCLVKVIGYDSSNIQIGEDISDDKFTIEVLKVTSPNGKEVFKSGSPLTITWRTNETIRPVSKVKLFYTTNGGSTWKLIKALKTNPGGYTWPFPSASSSNCKIKVVLKDSAGITVGSDMSDEVFTIMP
jgi:hypothetical protein